MCVIINKPWNVRSPDLETFERAMDNNPHGFAIAYKLPGKSWGVYKTMSKALMTDFLINSGVMKDKSKWVFHARIKTDGSANIKNTHCWKDDKTDLIFAHNGRLGVKPEKDRTDSETFFRNIVVPLYKHEGKAAAIKACEMIVENSSKIALVMEKELVDVVLIGNWIEREGCYYSNHSAFKPVYTPFQYPNATTTLQPKLEFDDELGGEFDSFDEYYQQTQYRRGQKLCKQETTHSHSQVTRTSTASNSQSTAA